MNQINSHNRVDDGVCVGSCRINRWLFENNFVLLESSKLGLQHPRLGSAAACDQVGMNLVLKIPRHYGLP